MAKVKARISKALQETVREHGHIEKVYFDAMGNHYFNAHLHTPTLKEEKETKGLYARIHRRDMLDENGRKVQISTPIFTSKIVETCDREDVLDAQAESDFILSKGMLNTLPPEAREAVEKLMAGETSVKIQTLDEAGK